MQNQMYWAAIDFANTNNVLVATLIGNSIAIAFGLDFKVSRPRAPSFNGFIVNGMFGANCRCEMCYRPL